MPKHFSSLKNIYRNTYEELKNPKSSIGFFLSKIDDYDFLTAAKEIRQAVKNYIDVFEREEKNFQEPDRSKKRVSYKAEQERLRHNLKVEKKLEEAVQKMNDALDIYAQARVEEKKGYTAADIEKMTDYKQKLKAQKERMLNAAYGLEVDLENRMIEKLKAEYKLFDHRPMESKVKIPPAVYNSPHYKIRHIELKGSTKVPTALYGLMRFRDLLNDHESLIKEAERSRQYEKFVNDRLAGFQAWKNTLAAEQKIYNEIRNAVDKDYFENYNRFMDQYAGTSTIGGYQAWYEETYQEIRLIENDIKDYEKQQKQIEDEIVEQEDNLKKQEAADEVEKNALDEEIRKIEEDPFLSQIFYDNNENTRIQAENTLKELEEELEKAQEGLSALNQEQDAARKTMLENVQWIQQYNSELNQLQEAMEEDAQKALTSFLEKYEDGAKKLDDTLRTSLEEFRTMAHVMTVHNENIQNTEKEISDYAGKVGELKAQIDDITSVYEAVKNKSEKDLKEQKTIGKFLIRTFNIGGKKEELKLELEVAENQKKMADDYEETIGLLQTNVDTNQKLLAEKQNDLEEYKRGWEKIHEELKVKVAETYEYTKDIQVKLSRLEEEKQQVNQNYEEQIKEIQKDTVEKKQSYKTILDKTSAEFDRLNLERNRKEREKKEIQDKINEVKEKIEGCRKNSEKIEKTKAKKEELLKSREEFEVKKEQRMTDLTKNLENTREKCEAIKTDLAKKRATYGSTVDSHNKMKKFYKEGKVTSNRVLMDLTAALSETMKIAEEESKKQLSNAKEKEDNLVANCAKKMNNKKWFAERMYSKEEGAEEKKETKENAGVYKYLEKLASMRKSNSKSFEDLKAAVMKQYDQTGEFLLNPEKADVKDEKQREKILQDSKEYMKGIEDTASAYLREKGSAGRFTQAGKERYRFADEMRTYAKIMLKKYEILEAEKQKTDELMKMDDSDLSVSKQLSFYKTTSYDMTKKAFVKEKEVDKMNMLPLGRGLADEKKEVQAPEESNEMEM